MTVKERKQNPVIGDDLTLRLFVYNSNNRANVNSVEKVDIYFLDPTEKSDSNPLGKRLVKTIPEEEVTFVEDGQYSISVNLETECFTIGDYIDEWHLQTKECDPIVKVENWFKVYPDLWYTTPIPIVYDFNYNFRPNKIRAGSKRWLIIDIVPNVPNGCDLERYYANLCIVSPLKISIEMACVECMPKEQDLRLIVDQEDVQFREKGQGFYFLDTEALDLDCGIYNVWFEMEFGESLYISDKQQLQIFT
ncbi:MAG: hypothetical protein ACW99G_14510 [Candidatus Thorarchaeota archaeon]|jgi:hypothetical protein